MISLLYFVRLYIVILLLLEHMFACTFDMCIKITTYIATVHLCTKFQVSNSTRFGDTLGCTPKFMGVT